MNIFVVGNSNSGKTFTLGVLANRFRSDGYGVETIRDWDIIKAKAKMDAGGGEIIDGWQVGEHCKIRYTEFDDIQIHARDGYLWNEAHWQMIQMAGDELPSSQIRLLEYATGPVSNFPGREPLLQTAHILAEKIREVATPHYLILALSAPYALRAQRNHNRGAEALADETFAAYFQDGGDLSLIDKFFLSERLLHINNTSRNPGEFIRELGNHYNRWIAPRIRLDSETVDSHDWGRRR